MLSLAEELLLLALHDEKGTAVVSAGTALPYGLGGALVMELTLQGRLELRGENLVVTDPTPAEDGLLNDALKRIGEAKRERGPKYWVGTLGHRIQNLKGRLLKELVQKGILRKEQRKILWIFPADRFPTTDAKPESEVRDRIRRVCFS